MIGVIRGVTQRMNPSLRITKKQNEAADRKLR
jgi:hypothetical protein